MQLFRTRLARGTVLICAAFAASGSQAAECKGAAAGAYNGKAVWKLAGGVGYLSSTLQVDADGAPNSYRVDGKGLSYTCDGSTAIGSTPDTKPKTWEADCNAAWKLARKTGNYSGLRIFGFETGPKNTPLIQKAGDPLPDAGYISMTSVPVGDGPAGTQRHWVDATQIPYVVLSGKFVTDFHVKPGDLAVVYRPSSNKFAFAAYGDGGKLGEASVRLHQDLGSNPMVTKGGVQRAKHGLGDTILTVVFPGAATHPTVNADAWRAEIAKVGAAALEKWGGADQLKACAK